MQTTTCDHCNRLVKSTLSLTGRIIGRDELTRDFCSLKCLRLWLSAFDKPAPLEPPEKEKVESALASIPIARVLKRDDSISIPITPESLSKHLGIDVTTVIADLMERNVFAKPSTCIETYDAEAVARKHGNTLTFQHTPGHVQ